MNPATLARQIRENSGDATRTAQSLGAGAISTVVPFLSDSDDDVRLTAAECLAVVASPALDADSMKAVQTAAIKLLTDDDDQIASIGANILHKIPPKDRNSELALAWSKASVHFIKEQAPILAGYYGTEHDRTAWVGFLASETDPETVGGLHTGLAKMGAEPSREWFLVKLLAVKGQPTELWIDRSVYMAESWVVPSLVKMLDRNDAAYTVSADHSPEIIRVQDLAAYAILTILKPPPGDASKPVPAPVAKRRYSPEEINQVRAIARAHAEKK